MHVHWPDAFLAADVGWRFWPRLLYLRLLALVVRLRGARLVWTAHNLQRDNQRNGKLIERFFWPWFLRRVDGVIYMTEASAIRARDTLPELRNTPAVVIPHGHYLPIVKNAGVCLTEQHGTPSALFFGSLTSYKNASKVLESFLELPRGEARLAIRGKMSLREPDKKLQSLLENLPDDRAQEIEFEDRFLTDKELVSHITETDLVVFPYSNVLNSGAAIFALSVGRPILASDNSLFRELRELVGPDWVLLINGELDGQQLSLALRHARTLRDNKSQPDLSALDWAGIAEATLDFYAGLIDVKRAGQ
jgi:glycosyltransferase involved in cell wall biosynthesis